MTQKKNNLDPLFIATQWFEQKRPLALVSVLETWGSGPRPAGSHLVVDEQGNFFGSVSGGCIEADVIETALEVITTGSGKHLEFGINNETAWQAGLSCGGTIRLYAGPVTDNQFHALEKLNQGRIDRELMISKTDLSNGQMDVIYGYELDNAGNSGHWRQEEVQAARDAILKARPVVTDTGDSQSFINIYIPRPHIVVIGAVHIAQALAAIVPTLDYDLSIIDPRTGFATSTRFPLAKVYPQWPEEVLQDHPFDAYTAVVALSHVPHIDDLPLIAALKKNCFYVGALGSRKTHAQRLDRLKEAGISEADRNRICGPVGLPIGARDPSEIAIAILAQIIEAYRTDKSA